VSGRRSKERSSAGIQRRRPTMAKPAAPPAAAKGGGMKNLLMLVVVALLAVGAGAAAPMLLATGTLKPATTEPETKGPKESKPAVIPFDKDAVVVNLDEARLTRYLRVKLLLVVDARDEKVVTDGLTKKKAFLKSWLLGHLASQTLEEVKGQAGHNRLRREILNEFNARLFPDGSEKIHDVLFEELYVQ
jgi:flagellar protein FliL